MTNREAYIILNLLPQIGPVRVKQLLTYFDEPKTILQESTERLARFPGIGGQRAEILSHWQDHCNLQEEMNIVEKSGVTLVTPEEEIYPTLLREIPDPPLCLYVRGRQEVLKNLQHSIALVGTRRASNYGTRMAQTLAGQGVNAGWVLVSGMARGIDTAAQRAVVKSKGHTVAVLGSGLGKIYPQENVGLAREITEFGAVISEFPMRYVPSKQTFPMRNRIISGMTRGTVVVQAGNNSGALITAQQALEQNRHVFAVPGPADIPHSRGSHALLKDGAKLVEHFTDILDEFQYLPGILSGLDKSGGGSSENANKESAESSIDTNCNLTEDEKQILELINEEMSVDTLIAQSGLPSNRVLATLVKLEMNHIVQQYPGKRVARVDPAQVNG